MGFLSGLGVGGGSLLILWLTQILGVEQSAARNINLLFFIPAALVTCRYRRKQGNLQLKQIIPGVIGGCAGAIAGSMLSSVLPEPLLKKLFGLLLLATGLRELFYRPKKKTSH